MQRPVGDAGVAAHGGKKAGRAVAGKTDGANLRKRFKGVDRARSRKSGSGDQCDGLEASVRMLEAEFRLCKVRLGRRWVSIEERLDAEAVFATNALKGSTLTHRETVDVITIGVVYGGIPSLGYAAAIGDARALGEARWIAAEHRRPVLADFIRLSKLLSPRDPLRIVSGFGPLAARSRSARGWGTDDPSIPAAIALAAVRHGGSKSAFDAHYELSISPEVDGAGRLARLFMNLLLILAGLPPVAIGWRLRGEVPRTRRKRTSRRERRERSAHRSPRLHA